jgi:hypothetical protein
MRIKEYPSRTQPKLSIFFLWIKGNSLPPVSKVTKETTKAMNYNKKIAFILLFEYFPQQKFGQDGFKAFKYLIIPKSLD